MKKVKLSLIGLPQMINKYLYLKKLVFIAVISLYLPFQTNLPAQVSKVWDYPVHSGTAEWKNLKTYKEKLNALNVPDSLLLRMSTKDLVITCLDYPYWILVTSRNNNQSGYNYIRSVFNGFRELESRVNACNELLTRYQKMNPAEITSIKTIAEQGKFSYQFVFIEILLSNYPILKNSSDDDKILALKTSLSFYEKKFKEPSKYSSYSISTTCLVLARILELSNSNEYVMLVNQHPELIEFVELANIPPIDLLNKIAISCSEYLKKIKL
jgi:hypothetical protein